MRVLKINKLVTGKFHVINICQRYPSYPLSPCDIPLGTTTSNSPLRGPTTVNFVSNPTQSSMPVYVKSLKGNRTVHEIPDRGSWIIKLNNQIPEPVVSIQVGEGDQKYDLPVLLDTGSSICVLSQEHLDLIKPRPTLLENDAACIGPDGTRLVCVGRTEINFKMGTEKYREMFYVLQARNDSTAILGYPFMVQNSIKIIPGEYVTNSVAPTPLRIQSIKCKSVGKIKIKPCHDFDIPPHSLTNISVCLSQGQVAGLEKFKYSPWSIHIYGSTPQVASMSSRGIFQITILNNSPTYKPAFKEDGYFGTAQPLVEFLNDPGPPSSVGRVAVQDIIRPKVMLSADVEVAEDGFTNQGFVQPDVLIPTRSSTTLDTTAVGIPIDSLGEEPCDSCRAKRAKIYCNFDMECKNLNSPWHNPHAPARVEVVKRMTGTAQHSTAQQPKVFIESHTRQLISDKFSRRETLGGIVWCDSVPHPWFLPNHNNLSREQVDFVTLSPRKLGMVVRHAPDRAVSSCTDTKMKDDIMVQTVNSLVATHGINKLFLSCHCLNILATQGFLRVSHIIAPVPQGICGQQVREVTHTPTEFVASDKMSQGDEPDILSSDPCLIKKYKEIIKANEDLFSKTSWDIGLFKNPQTDVPYVFSYRLKAQSEPYVAKFRPIAPLKRAAATQMIDSLLQAGIISRRVTPWIANSVWATKARPILTKQQAKERNVEWEGQIDSLAPISLRLTVSYVRLNACLEFLPTPLPNIRRLFGDMRKSDTLTVLDLTWSYFSLKICPVSSTLTGFWSGIPSDISLCFNRCPMGITPSSGFLQSAVTSALSPLKQWIINYSDNIILHTPSHLHLEVVDKTFELLRRHGLKVKKSKVAIHVRQRIKLLGCIFDISSQTLHPDPEKTAALRTMAYPNSITKLKAFLGAYQFMVHFLHDSAQPLARLYQQTRGSPTVFCFDDAAKQDFDKLIDIALNPANFIYFIDYSLDIILRVDSSTDAVGWTLLQYLPDISQFRSCGYGVKCFSAIQQRYGPSEREILGAIVALKANEGTLFGANCIIQMDCRGAILVTATSETNSKMKRYLSYIETFSPPLKFQWVAGKDKMFQVPDMLSRTTSNTQDQPQVVNKKIMQQEEDCIDKLANKLNPGIAEIVDFPIIMDYIYSLGDSPPTKAGSIFMSPQGHVCLLETRDGPCVSIMHRKRERPHQQNIPLTQEDLGKLNIDSKEETFEHSIGTIATQPFDTISYDDLADTGVSKQFIEELDHTSIEQRFLSYIVSTFPLLNVRQLITLQHKDTFLKEIIDKCETMREMCWKKKKNVEFVIIKEVLLRRWMCPIYGWMLQIALPKFCLTDVLLSLHRSIVTAHMGVKRLIDRFSEHFFSPHATEYARLVIDNCFICTANKNRERTLRGNYPHKVAITIDSPGQFWYADVLQIVSKHTSDTHSALCFSDAYSGFIVAAPFKGNMDNNTFIKIFEERILSIFPQVRVTLTDNAVNISGPIIKQHFHNLNIQFINSRPYSSKSNIVEGFQRLLLRSLRIGMQQLALPAEFWPRLVPSAVISLNCTPYMNLRYNITPHTVMMGTPPRLESLFTVSPDRLAEGGYDSYVVQLAKSKYASSVAMMEFKRHKLLNNEKTQRPQDQRILPGDLVFRHVRQNSKIPNYKLRPRNSKIFLVVLTTSTSAFCREFKGGDVGGELKSFQDFLDCPKDRKGKILPPFPLVHLDQSDLVRVKNLITVSSDTKKLTENLEKFEFPGSFTVELDVEEGEGIPLDYDVEGQEPMDEVGPEPLRTLDPLSQVKKVRSVIKIKKDLRFSAVASWIDDNGIRSDRPLTTKYSLYTPKLTSCI